jgi:hypothetical protein
MAEGEYFHDLSCIFIRSGNYNCIIEMILAGADVRKKLSSQLMKERKKQIIDPWDM